MRPSSGHKTGGNLMKRIATLVAGITLLGLSVGTACVPDRGPQTPTELDPHQVAAWKNAGAKAYWLVVDESGYWDLSEVRPKNPAALPVFRWAVFEPGVIAELPAPSARFVLDLGGTKVTDRGLKELAGLKNLQILSLNCTQVKGWGLKELAGLKSLQTLDLPGL